MSVSLAEVIKHTRLRHPAFTRETVSNVALAEVMSDYQRELIKLSADRLYSLVVDRFSIVFDHGDTDPAALLMTATDFGVVTGVPAYRVHEGSGIELDAEDFPVTDSASDLTVSYQDGLTLPVYHKLLPGTALYSTEGGVGSSDPSSSPVILGGRHSNDFRVVAYDQRLDPPHFPSGYVLDGKLYLTGSTNDWMQYASIDVRYVPLPVNFTAVTEVFRLPEICREALNARCDLAAAEWAQAKGRENVDVKQFRADKVEAEEKVLAAVSDRQSNLIRTMKRNR